MCEHCDAPPPPEVKQAYEDFEAAIKKFMGATGHDEGILVDWVLCTASNIIQTNVDATFTGWTAGLNQPMYRSKGLIHSIIEGHNAEGCADAIHRRFSE